MHDMLILKKLRFHSYLITMPKKQKSKQAKTAESNSAESAKASTPSIPISQSSNSDIYVQILAKPGAKANGVTDISPEGIGIQISAPPVEGEANVELVKYVASVVGIKKSEVSLERGSKSRQKTIALRSADLTVESVLEKFKAAIAE